MALTYYDMEKLMRMTYDQKLSASRRNIMIARSKVRNHMPTRAGFVPDPSEQSQSRREQCVVI